MSGIVAFMTFFFKYGPIRASLWVYSLLSFFTTLITTDV